MLQTRTIERAGFEPAQPADQTGTSPELRQLGWAEIIARLAAARDLRLLLRAAAEGRDDESDCSGAAMRPSDQK